MSHGIIGHVLSHHSGGMQVALETTSLPSVKLHLRMHSMLLPRLSTDAAAICCRGSSQFRTVCILLHFKILRRTAGLPPHAFQLHTRVMGSSKALCTFLLREWTLTTISRARLRGSDKTEEVSSGMADTAYTTRSPLPAK